MSVRGVNFLSNWMADHLPNAFTDDPGAISDLADQAIKAADKQGIPQAEISEDIRSVFEVILEGMRYRESKKGFTNVARNRTIVLKWGDLQRRLPKCPIRPSPKP